MAYYESRGSSIRVTVRLGNGERQKRTFDTRAEAEAWAASLEAKAALGMTSAIRSAGKTAAEVFRLYLEHVSVERDSQRFDTLKLTAWQSEPLGQLLLEQITPQTINEWITKRKKQPYRGKLPKVSTIQRELNLMSGVFAYAQRSLQWIDENPVHGAVKLPAAPPRKRPALTKDEIKALLIAHGYDRDPKLKTLTARVAACFLLALETGMRSGEILCIRRKDYNRQARTVLVAAIEQGGRKGAKSGRLNSSRLVPLTDEAIRVLDQLSLSAPKGADTKLAQLDSSQRDAIWRKARDQAGVQGLTFHDTKHEACTRLAKFLDVFELSYAVGTKNIQLLRDTYYQNDASLAAAKLPTKLSQAL